MAGKKGCNFVPLLIRFTRSIKVNIKTGCWEWQLSRDVKGYGNFTFNGKHSRAHRYSFIHYIGELKAGELVLHKCDNPPCCNPFHLFKGSDYDNTMDSINKGRRPKAEHGSITMYCTPYRCRCEPCVKAGREYFSNRGKSKKM